MGCSISNPKEFQFPNKRDMAAHRRKRQKERESQSLSQFASASTPQQKKQYKKPVEKNPPVASRKPKNRSKHKKNSEILLNRSYRRVNQLSEDQMGDRRAYTENSVNSMSPGVKKNGKKRLNHQDSLILSQISQFESDQMFPSQSSLQELPKLDLSQVDRSKRRYSRFTSARSNKVYRGGKKTNLNKFESSFRKNERKGDFRVVRGSRKERNRIEMKTDKSRFFKQNERQNRRRSSRSSKITITLKRKGEGSQASSINSGRSSRRGNNSIRRNGGRRVHPKSGHSRGRLIKLKKPNLGRTASGDILLKRGGARSTKVRISLSKDRVKRRGKKSLSLGNMFGNFIKKQKKKLNIKARNGPHDTVKKSLFRRAYEKEQKEKMQRFEMTIDKEKGQFESEMNSIASFEPSRELPCERIKTNNFLLRMKSERPRIRGTDFSSDKDSYLDL
jgi:hypothetical protein